MYIANYPWQESHGDEDELEQEYRDNKELREQLTE